MEQRIQTLHGKCGVVKERVKKDTDVQSYGPRLRVMSSLGNEQMRKGRGHVKWKQRGKNTNFFYWTIMSIDESGAIFFSMEIIFPQIRKYYCEWSEIERGRQIVTNSHIYIYTYLHIFAYTVERFTVKSPSIWSWNTEKISWSPRYVRIYTEIKIFIYSLHSWAYHF